MKIITLNLNGIRSAAKKGFFDWLKKENADIICVQELKAQDHILSDPLFRPEGYHCYFHCAEKKGYSGVGIYTRIEPKEIIKGLGWQSADTEGRCVSINLGGVWVSSLYMPSGTSGAERQKIKFDFLQRYTQHLLGLNEADQHIICGDFNIAHKEIDLKNWRANQKNSGFLPEERAWLDQLFNKLPFIDAFRAINTAPEHYTWWSNRGRAREKNVGWRIDYQIVSSGLKPTIKSAKIFTNQRFSDHAPLIMDYDILF